jgi:hypothetical protein
VRFILDQLRQHATGSKGLEMMEKAMLLRKSTAAT